MRQLKYANLFTYATPPMPPDSTPPLNGHLPSTSTTTEIAAEIPAKTTTPLRKRRSGFRSTGHDAPDQRRNSEAAYDSDIFSDALTEAEDTVDPEDPAVDYRRLHRVSFAQQRAKPDFSFKVCIVGDANVGKTTLLLSLTDGGVGAEGNSGVRTPKVGIGGREKLVYSNAKRRLAKCRLEDTAGQERYKSLTSAFYRNSFGCLILYDVTREETFNHVEGWFKDVRMYAEPEICVVLVAAHSVGTSDEARAAEALAARRVVSAEEGGRKAEQFEVPYVEANVRREAEATVALETLVDVMIDKLDRRRSNTPVPDRYQSPDLRRSYRPSTVTRRSLVDIARANATKAVKPRPPAEIQTSSSVRLDLASDQRDQDSARPRKGVSCC